MRTEALLLVLLAGAPVLAGEQPADPLARTAKRYGQDAWPAAGPERRGVVPQTIQPTGWRRVSLRLDARRGEARLGFAPRVEGKGRREPPAATARVTLRVHDDVRAARRALLSVLAASQTTLTREEGWGEVAFGKRLKGRLGYVAFVQGNITAVVHAPGLEAGALATAAQAAIQASAPIEPSAEVRAALAPRIQTLSVGPRKGRAVVLNLETDPAAPAAAATAIDVVGGSVLKTRAGHLLYTRRGEVTVTVFLVSKELRVRRRTVTLKVPIQ